MQQPPKFTRVIRILPATHIYDSFGSSVVNFVMLTGALGPMNLLIGTKRLAIGLDRGVNLFAGACCSFVECIRPFISSLVKALYYILVRLAYYIWEIDIVYKNLRHTRNSPGCQWVPKKHRALKCSSLRRVA